MSAHERPDDATAMDGMKDEKDSPDSPRVPSKAKSRLLPCSYLEIVNATIYAQELQRLCSKLMAKSCQQDEVRRRLSFGERGDLVLTEEEGKNIGSPETHMLARWSCDALSKAADYRQQEDAGELPWAYEAPSPPPTLKRRLTLGEAIASVDDEWSEECSSEPESPDGEGGKTTAAAGGAAAGAAAAVEAEEERGEKTKKKKKKKKKLTYPSRFIVSSSEDEVAGDGSSSSSSNGGGGGTGGGSGDVFMGDPKATSTPPTPPAAAGTTGDGDSWEQSQLLI